MKGRNGDLEEDLSINILLKSVILNKNVKDRQTSNKTNAKESVMGRNVIQIDSRQIKVRSVK